MRDPVDALDRDVGDASLVGLRASITAASRQRAEVCGISNTTLGQWRRLPPGPKLKFISPKTFAEKVASRIKGRRPAHPLAPALAGPARARLVGFAGWSVSALVRGRDDPALDTEHPVYIVGVCGPLVSWPF